MVEPTHTIDGPRRTPSLVPVVYSQPDCPGCENVRRFLQANGVEFVEHDISADEAALQDFEGLGRPATPVTVVGDSVIWGFNRRALLKALGFEA
jgi:glutaredoxin